jgi:hypothetical protein
VKAGAGPSGAIALIFALFVGCKGSVSAEANVGDEGAKARAQAEMSESSEAEGELNRRALSATAQQAADVEAASRRVLLGARHDLKLQSGKATTSCQCLAVALGAASESGMAWSGGAPQLDASTQLSIALSSEGQPCQDEPKQSLGASYWGYRLSGNDVVVLVEAARAGRPQTSGAIIPKPVGSGQVFVAPASSRLPYGRPLEGKGMCKIGNPGPARTAPFSELEVGSDAPRPATGDVTFGRSNVIPNPTEAVPSTIEIPSD